MAASTSILADNLHEYPQQDVIDGTSGASASILDDCLNNHDGVLQLSAPLRRPDILYARQTPSP